MASPYRDSQCGHGLPKIFRQTNFREDLQPKRPEESARNYGLYVRTVLQRLFGALYVGVPGFEDNLLEKDAGLWAFAKQFVDKEQEVQVSDKFVWTGWPGEDSRDPALSIQQWLLQFTEKLTNHAGLCRDNFKLLPTRANQPSGLIGRDMAICDVNGFDTKMGVYRWSDPVIPVHIASNLSQQWPWMQWYRLGELARDILDDQDNRRFVIGVSFSKSRLRAWVFDRLGGLAGTDFDIHEEPQNFVYVMMSLFCMNNDRIGYSPFFQSGCGKSSMSCNIEAPAGSENLTLNERLAGQSRLDYPPSIASRGTACWVVSSDTSPNLPLVMKFSWLPFRRDIEGDLLGMATHAKVENVARLYAHGEIPFYEGCDSVLTGIRGGLEVDLANVYKLGPSSSPVDRIPRYLVTQDRGKPVYTASSPSQLLSAFEDCVEGHKGLSKIGILHRDISLRNMLINEDPANPSWPAFLVDLDTAYFSHEGPAPVSKTNYLGTTPYTAIEVLLGEKNTLKHDLEAFFWVFFWLCTHYSSGGEDAIRVPSQFEEWEDCTFGELAKAKQMVVEDFAGAVEEGFTPYYRPLIPCAIKWKEVLFPDNRPRIVTENEDLHHEIKIVLLEARRDLLSMDE